MKWIHWLGLFSYLLVIVWGYPQSDSVDIRSDPVTSVEVTDDPREVTVKSESSEVDVESQDRDLENKIIGDSRARKTTVPGSKTPLPPRRTSKAPPNKKNQRKKKPLELSSDYGTFSPTSFENKLPFDGKETEEEEDDENSSEEYNEDFFYDEIEPVFSSFTRRPPAPYTLEYDSKEGDDGDEDDDDEYYEDDYDASHKDDADEDMSFSSFLMDLFYEVYARFTGAAAADNDESNYDDEDFYDENNYAARRTTPRGLSNRKSKRPSYNQFLGFYEEEFGNKIQSKTAKVKRQDDPVAESKWLSWFDEPAETTIPPVESTTQPMTTTTTTEGSWSLFNLFNNNEKDQKSAKRRTTPSPLATSSVNPIPALISALSEHLVTTTTTTPGPTAADLPVSQPSTQKSYRNFQLWRLKPLNEDHVTALKAIRLYQPVFQWWQGPTLEGKTDVLVPPDKVDELRELLSEEGIKHTTTIRDLEMAIKFSNPQMPRSESFQLEAIQGHPMTWHRYHRYADIVKYFEYLRRKYPSNVDLLHIGRTFEGRPIIVCHIFESGPVRKQGKKKRVTKQSIFIESGMRGREWIGPAVATWILEDMSRNNFHLTNRTLDGLSLTRDFYILPVANPDGYEFTHTTDRLWTKNRSRKKKTSVGFFSNFFSLAWFTKGMMDQEDLRPEAECLGVDLNRNFDYRWNRDENVNSRSGCSDDYAGTRPFSETETRALARFLIKVAPTLKLYVSLQAYGQFLSLPRTRQLPLERLDMIGSAESAVNSLRKFGLPLVKYFVDEDSSLRDSVAGASDGFVTRELEVQRAVTIKLRDTGENGFLLPPSYIETTARETYEMIKIMVDDLRRKG